MRTFILASAVTVLLGPVAVQAQTNCAARDKVIATLEGKYGEVFAGGGLQNSSQIYEVWFSEAQGTWTILMTRADGTACVMASGTDWRDALPSSKVLGIPS